MKALLFMILFFLFTTVGIPLLFIGLMYDGSSPNDIPIHLYTEDIDAWEMLYEQLDEAIDQVRTNEDSDFDFSLHQDILNIAIFNLIRGDGETEGLNPDYLPDENCVESSCKYIVEETIELENRTIYLRVIGIWVTFEDDTFIGNVAFELQHNDGFTYKTTIKTEFLLIDDIQEQEYNVEFKRLKLGNLPLPKGLFSPIIGLVERIGNTDFSEVNNNIELGTLDVKNLSYTLTKQEIVDRIQANSDEDPMMTLAAEVVSIIFEQGLIRFLLVEENINFMLRISLIRNHSTTSIPDYLAEMNDEDGFNPNSFDYEAHLKARFEAFVFNMALTGETALTIHDRTFNKILYHSFQGFTDTRTSFSYTNSQGVEETIEVGLEALWFEFKKETIDTEDFVYIEIKGLFNIGGIKSLLVIRADEVQDYEEGKFAFDISEISLGKELGKDYLSIVELDPFKVFLEGIDDFEFGYVSAEKYLVIDTSKLTGFLEDGTVDGTVEVTSISIVNGGIRIVVAATDPNLQGILDQFSDAVYDVFENDFAGQLQGVLNTVDDGPEKSTYESVQSIQDKINSAEPVTEDDVADLFEHYEQMSPEAQQAFIETLEGLIDETLLNDFKNNFQN